jgi:protein-tyrosine-phosphatase
MAEAFARRIFASGGLVVSVAWWGLLAGGRPPLDEVIDLMRERDLDVSDHRSQTISAELLGSASLVIGMERRHIEEIIAIAPEAFVRSFTLPELVRRVEGLPPSEGEPRSIAESVARISTTRTNRDLLRITVAEEILDPIGRSGRTFDQVADQIEELLNRFVSAQWPVDDAYAALSGPEH